MWATLLASIKDENVKKKVARQGKNVVDHEVDSEIRQQNLLTKLQKKETRPSTFTVPEWEILLNLVHVQKVKLFYFMHLTTRFLNKILLIYPFLLWLQLKLMWSHQMRSKQVYQCMEIFLTNALGK